MTKRTNEQWLQELQANGAAYETALTDLRQILMLGLQRGLLGRVNTSAPEFESQAEDFVQEAMLKILKNLHTFAGRSQFTTWAHKIAVSVALTELRRKRWQDKSLDAITDTPEGIYTPSFMADPAPKPENVTERADVLAQVNRLIEDELTEKQRMVIVSAVIEGLSTNEVANRMNMKPNAVYKLLHDARLRLRRRLAKEGMTPGDIISTFE